MARMRKKKNKSGQACFVLVSVPVVIVGAREMCGWRLVALYLESVVQEPLYWTVKANPDICYIATEKMNHYLSAIERRRIK